MVGVTDVLHWRSNTVNLGGRREMMLSDSTAGGRGRKGLVLVANDHEWTARSVETILVAGGYDVVRAFTGRESLELAARHRPDVFILDHQLPDFSGLEVCRLLREDPVFGASTPIMITTAGPSGRTQRLAAYEAGAWEFYGQPLDGEALLHKVRVYLSARAEVVRLVEAGLLDAVTGLYNRAGLARRATELAAQAHRRGEALACVAINLAAEGGDGAGVGTLLRSLTRASDACGMVGPGAFAVVGSTDARHGAATLADRLREAFRSAGTAVRVAVVAAESPESLAGDLLMERVETAFAA